MRMIPVALLSMLVACTRGAPDTGGADAATTGFEAETCESVTQYDAPETLGEAGAGLEYCWDDDPFHPRWNRTSAPGCTTDAATFVGECNASNPDAPCSTDADCGGDRCTNSDYGTSCECVHVCNGDGDCGAGESCLCTSGYLTPGGSVLDVPGSCLPSTCASSADCDGEPCGMYIDICQQPSGFACHTEADLCRWDSDCAGDELCTFDGSGWGCRQYADCE